MQIPVIQDRRATFEFDEHEMGNLSAALDEFIAGDRDRLAASYRVELRTLQRLFETARQESLPPEERDS